MTCDRCGQEFGRRRRFSIAGVGQLCSLCHDEWAAQRLGVDYDRTPLEPVTVIGPDGRAHTFDIDSRIDPVGRALLATERTPDGSEGYEFEVIGGYGDDAFALMAELHKRIRAGVEHVWLETTEEGLVMPRNGDRFRGRLVWSASDDGPPSVVIDGRPYTWEQVGELLSIYEGFEIEVRLEDPIALVGGARPQGRGFAEE